MKSRRKWIRFPKDATHVTVGGDAAAERQMEVVDESFGGMSGLLDDVTGLHPDQPVTIRYREIQVEAVVRYVRPAANGRHRLGFEWTTPEND